MNYTNIPELKKLIYKYKWRGLFYLSLTILNIIVVPYLWLVILNSILLGCVAIYNFLAVAYFLIIIESLKTSKTSQGNKNYILNIEKLDHAYQLLKLSKTDSIETIKKKYKALSVKWHPDKWATSSEETQKIVLSNFQKLQAAYDLIKKDKGITK